MASGTTEKKARVAKVRSPLELELHAAQRVGDMLKGMTLKQRARVLALVQLHTLEALGDPTPQKTLADMF